MKSAVEKRPKKKKKLGRVAPKHTPTSDREVDHSKKPKTKKEGPLEKRPKKKKKLGRVSAKHTPTSPKEVDYSKKPKTKKTGPIKKKMDNSAAANQLKELGSPNKKIGDKLKAKIKNITTRKKKPIGRVSAQHSQSTKREVDYSKKPGKKTGPVKKTEARIAQDYARNAEVDGNTSEGKYERKMAIKTAAGNKKGAIYKKGSVLSKHFKSN